MSDNGEVEGLREELEELASKIDATMEEVAAIRHPMMQHDRVNSAVDELAAIVAATEVATEQILDAAEQLEEMTEGLDEVVANKIGEVVTGIYEASNFQDITGQRITKVTSLLRELDDRLASIVETYGEDAFVMIPPPAAAEGDAALLNGPASANTGGGMGQDNIDSLFD